MRVGVFISNAKLLNGTGTYIKMLQKLNFDFFTCMSDEDHELVESFMKCEVTRIENDLSAMDGIYDVIINTDAFGKYADSDFIERFSELVPMITVVHSYWYNTVPERLKRVSEMSKALWIFRDTYYKYCANQYDFETTPVYLMSTFHPVYNFLEDRKNARNDKLCVLGRQLSNTGEDKIRLTSIMKSMDIKEIDIYGGDAKESTQFFGMTFNYKGSYNQNEVFKILNEYEYCLYDRPVNRLGQQFEWTLQEILLSGTMPIMPSHFLEDMTKAGCVAKYYDASNKIINPDVTNWQSGNVVAANKLYSEEEQIIETIIEVLGQVSKLK